MKQLFKNAFSLDLRALSLLRMGVGATLLVDLLYRLVNLTNHYTDCGILPRQTVFNWSSLNVSLHFISGRWEIQLLIFLLAITFAVMLIIGHKTRVATIFSWLLLISLHNRNPFILQGGDEYLRMILFWCMFLPWNRVYALDSLTKPKPKTYRYFSIACIPLIVQVMLLYIIPTYSRITSQWLSEGTALYYALSLDQMTRPIGLWLHQFPVLLKTMTHYVFWIERLGPLLFIIPWKNHIFRTTGIFLFITLHIGMGLCMMLGIFPFIGALVPLGLLPTPAFNKLEKWAAKRYSATAEKIKLAMMSIRLFLRDDVPATLVATVKRNKFDRYYINTMLLGAFVFVLAYNIERIGKIRMEGFGQFIPENVRGAGYLLKLNQHWQMFSPYVSEVDGWYIMKATLNNNEQVALFQPKTTLTDEKPGNMLNYYKSDRWRKYFENFYRERELLAGPFAKYLCRNWNENHSENEQLKQLDIVYMLEETLPDYQSDEIEKYTLATYFVEKDSVAVF